VDAPCGDCNWQTQIEGFDAVQYTGLDIVPDLIRNNRQRFSNLTNVHYAEADFMVDPIPPNPDLVICRDAIMHNTLRDGVQAYLNFERSGATYIATTWFQWPDDVPDGTENPMINPGGFFKVDLFRPPFNFSKPLFFIAEGEDGNAGMGKSFGIWRLPVLGMGDGRPFQINPWIRNEMKTRVVFLEEMSDESPALDFSSEGNEGEAEEKKQSPSPSS